MQYNNLYNDMELTMDTMSYSSVRKNLSSVLDKVNQDHMPVVITRQNGEDAVLMSLKDYKSYEETAYLMASVRNAERLNRSIENVEAGKVIQRDLIEE